MRREILPSGKSRAFINDTPVSVTQLKSLGEQLIDIHSQHQNLLLADSHFQLRVSIRWPEILVYCPIINGSIVRGMNY